MSNFVHNGIATAEESSEVFFVVIFSFQNHVLGVYWNFRLHLILRTLAT